MSLDGDRDLFWEIKGAIYGHNAKTVTLKKRVRRSKILGVISYMAHIFRMVSVKLGYFDQNLVAQISQIFYVRLSAVMRTQKGGKGKIDCFIAY